MSEDQVQYYLMYLDKGGGSHGKRYLHNEVEDLLREIGRALHRGQHFEVKKCEVLICSPESESEDWTWYDRPTELVIGKGAAKTTVNGVPLDEWMEQFQGQ